ncbi:Dimethylglycine oxidase [Geodia barretti]|uniref:Dimethylglycine oxidase n=1 Tax=Geodia barretti TaxID=519541 RepID=A0AA35RCG9_GEOBA|nr:Dimethylglycine oxidase [Geodia barretti]
MAGFAKYTVDLWSGMQLDGEQCAKNVGSLEVAWTPERLADLKRKAGYGMSWGIEGHVISPSEAREFIPMLSECILVRCRTTTNHLVDAEDILDHEDAYRASETEFTPKHFERLRLRLVNCCPAEGRGLTRKFNGMFSFTTDGFPAGGVGKAVAEWIVNGEPTTDLRECDIRRFHPHAYTRPYVKARAAQQYREVYDIITRVSSLRIHATCDDAVLRRQQDWAACSSSNAGWERLSGTTRTRAAGFADGHRRDAHRLGGAGVVADRGCGACRHGKRVAMFDMTPFANFE